MSAEQTEGEGITNKASTVFSEHFSKKPGDFWGEIGPSKTIDFMRNYKDDIKLLKSFNINSHRTSLSWARLFPTGDYTSPNMEAVRFYHDMIDEYVANGITLFITIYHFDMPSYALLKGGFESREVWDDFLRYVKFIFEEYSPKVKYWTTMNEPWVPVQSSYIAGIQAPFLKDEQRAVNAAYGIVMCHAKAVNYFNENIKNKYKGMNIGGIFDSKVVYPKDPENEADVKAALHMDLYQFTGLTDAAILGKWRPELVEWVKEMELFPKNFKKSDVEELSKIKLDFIGLNFYSPARAMKPTDTPSNKFEEYFNEYEWPERRENKFRGWEIYPNAVYDTLKAMLDRYGNQHKYMLTEFGMGVENESMFRDRDGKIDDQYRIAFIKEHLVSLNKFMNDFDVEVIGAHVWAAFDCWSWNNSFKNTYGLIEVNLKNMQRIPKASAYFYRDLIQNNGFEGEFNRMEHYMDFDKIDFSESIKL